VIYLDASVALAQLFGEGRSPPDGIWDGLLISSSLLEYEVWNRIHARGLGAELGGSASALIDRLTLLELTPHVLARALRPFPLPVRTLDALHLASVEFVRTRDQSVALATYDDRLAAAARALGIPLATV
jgi:predicted nucleic acid-binding protein